jgi:hypothetical protein
VDVGHLEFDYSIKTMGPLILLAVLVLLPQSSPPQRQNDEANATDHNAHTTIEKQQPNPTAVYQAVTEKNGGPHNGPAEEKAAIKRFDYEFWAFWVNLALVIATFILAIYAVKQASAAQLGARAVINSERPWFVVYIEKAKDDWKGGFEVCCLNQGNTPGEIISMSAHWEFVDKPDNLPVPPDYSHPVQMPDLTLIVHGDSFPIGDGIKPELILGREDRTPDVHGGRQFLAYYGIVVYRDKFFPENAPEGKHETRWCFIYLPEGGLTQSVLRVINPVGKFVRSGPKEFNGYT